jgi:transcription antitermination factor NusG
MDQRDDKTWAIIELTRLGEQKAEDGSLVSSIYRALKTEDVEVFVPLITYEKHGRTVIIHLLEGYVFIETGLPETTYFRLENESYVAQVMTTFGGGQHRMKVLSVISNEKVLEMKKQLRSQVAGDLTYGEKVKAVDGVYSRLEGTIMDLEEEDAIIKFDLRSLSVITKIPKVFLEVVNAS